ncbi:hypothetical protein PpBr36_06869, partial [Pyricularia pennisetigena]|uniref:hypothetical protein n=1 Tax=Pyricularia pennisetigena TaxID=1578925 RepID=UPI00114F4D95
MDMYKNLATVLASTILTSSPMTYTLMMQMQDEKSLQGQSPGASGMSMVFFSSQATPLFSRAWTPSTPEAYAGTCIFIFLLTITQYLLLALRNAYFEDFERQTTATFANAFQERGTKPADPAKDEDERPCLSHHGTDTHSLLPSRTSAAEKHRRKSQMTIATARAACEVVISAAGYLVQRRRKVESGAER